MTEGMPRELIYDTCACTTIRTALPDMPISIDTTKPEIAAAALDAGADLLNDIWGTADDSAMTALAVERGGQRQHQRIRKVERLRPCPASNAQNRRHHPKPA